MDIKYTEPLLGKIKISATLRLLTGLHIGASNEFSSIGAVDSVVVRDPLTKIPLIPGSSLKGKIRHLISQAYPGGPFYNVEEEPLEIMRLFGGKQATDKNQLVSSRLQFCDLLMNEASVQKIAQMKTDLYLTEIKFENGINRTTGEANPRQMERVVAGAEFDFFLVYNIEDAEQVTEDFENLAMGLKLLQMDYLGGGGTRGNGRISIADFTLDLLTLSSDLSIDINHLQSMLEETSAYALLSV